MNSLGKLVQVENGSACTTSLLVAEKFGKLHKNVLNAINSVQCSEEFRELNFKPSSYTTIQNKGVPMYKITRDGFVFLVMGFTGSQAARFKEEYINAFNEAERRLRGEGLTGIDLLRNMLDQIEKGQQEINLINSRVDLIEAKQTNVKNDYFSVVGYSTLNGYKINLSMAGAIGRKATRLCNDRGYPVDTVPDPRFGKVNVYPSEVLQEVFNEFFTRVISQ